MFAHQPIYATISSFFQKKENKKCCKRSHYVRGSELEELTKEAAYIYIYIYIYCQDFINYFLKVKVDFENKITLSQPSAKLGKFEYVGTMGKSRCG
jgi:hypothetical protein